MCVEGCAGREGFDLRYLHRHTHDSLNPFEGITLKLADEPDMGCDMMITFLPYLSDDGRALLKIDCYSVPYQNDADEKIVPTAYDWMDELDELDDPDIDTIF